MDRVMWLGVLLGQQVGSVPTHPTVSTSLVPQWLLWVLAGFGGIAAIVAIFLRGIWAKLTEEQLRPLFTAWMEEVNTREGRKKFVQDIIDNEVHRDDGLIHRSLTAQTTALAQALTTQTTELVKPLTAAIAELKNSIDSKTADDREILNRLHRIEGQLAVALTSLRLTPPGGTPVPPPPAS